MTTDLVMRAETFRSAVEADDVPTAGAALAEYVACFRSEARTLADVAHASELIEAGLVIAVTRRAALAAELGRLMTVSSGYGGRRISSTWRLDG